MSLRLRRVVGVEGRVNDALYRPPRAPVPSTHTVVFFGGDVQDYPEVMQSHRDNRNYIRWNLDNTAKMISGLFPTSHVVVVRPSRIEYKSFSCYDNFVPSNNAGVPDHTPTHSALLHLERLLQGVGNRLKSMPTTELLEAIAAMNLPEEIDIEDLHTTPFHSVIEPNPANGSSKMDTSSGNEDLSPVAMKPENLIWWLEDMSLEESALTLIGFSKGCVVLNQLLYEFHYTKTLTPGDTHTMRFIERIENMYWLDGGHGGGKNTWITSRSLLETLNRLNINIFVHVSPYQVKDESRPWIGREEKTFTTLLRKMGANIQRYFHTNPNMPLSLQVHFDVLANFKRIQEHPPTSADSSDEEM